MSGRDCIVALASGAGKAGVAVLRLSGADVFALVERFLDGSPLPQTRRAALRKLIDPLSGDLLDEALILTFAAPASFTGEDVVEIQGHGSPSAIKALIEALCRAGARLAEPGEFTRRAFENGRMDLSNVEGLADLIDAQTTAQRDLAFRQMDGRLADRLEVLRRAMLDTQAQIEAVMEFPDEDLGDSEADAIRPMLAEVLAEVEDMRRSTARGEVIRDGFRVVLLGAPNAGKSTLLNLLTGSDHAIVTDEPGTTRDVISVSIDVDGYLVHLSDTAGLRNASNKVEVIGIERARQAAEEAQLKLVLISPDGPEPDAELLAHAEGQIVLFTKADLDPMFHVKHSPLETKAAACLRFAQHDAAALETLIQSIARVIEDRLGDGEAPLMARARHQGCLDDIADHLTEASAMLSTDLVLAAESVRLAIRSLGRISGRVGVEDMLDHLFSGFCIGK